MLPDREFPFTALQAKRNTGENKKNFSQELLSVFKQLEDASKNGENVIYCGNLSKTTIMILVENGFLVILNSRLTWLFGGYKYRIRW